MIKRVFILGNHIQALGLVRQAYDKGMKVYLFTDSAFSISRFSKAVSRTFIFKSVNDLLNLMHSLKAGYKDALLFPTNDFMVYFLKENYDLLKQHYYLGIASPSTVDIFYNKRNTYQFAEQHNISIPQSWYPNNLKDVYTISQKIDYPVILKPAVMNSFHNIFGKKAFKCNNEKELIDRAKNISQKIPVQDLIIQEFLDGGAEQLFSFGTFAVNGKPVVSVMANRIRQNPMDFGNSTTFAKTCNIPEIKRIAERILKERYYFGLAEVEFMYDKNSNQYKFLEINPRAWKWHSISNNFNFSFLGKMIDYFNRNLSDEKNITEENIAWVERFTDFFVVLKELFKGNMILKKVIASYSLPKTYAVWSKKDPLPFFMYFLLSPILFIKRH